MKRHRIASLLGLTSVTILLIVGKVFPENRFNVITFADDHRISNLQQFYQWLNSFLYLRLARFYIIPFSTQLSLHYQGAVWIDNYLFPVLIVY